MPVSNSELKLVVAATDLSMTGGFHKCLEKILFYQIQQDFTLLFKVQETRLILVVLSTKPIHHCLCET